ncbi:AraC family transcriptional regulator [Bacillus sp. BRMEA1]|uniref:GyrI-like domain-containing protein n=1 Tax=Neobacillus endophyticus TaxID=2738405 RepID=UPI0015644FFA|nr:GyrI-like domain-containing protein [Neobacillus endophyticus]NRD76806.1 AraC family transcriptional regulator [Neobacillus endophyticus]
MELKIVDRERFQIVGVKREFSGLNGENLTGIPKMWEKVLTDGTGRALIQLNNGEIHGLMGVCVDHHDKQPLLMDYWIAVETDANGSGEFMKLDIPASQWGVFEVHGPIPEAIQQAWERIYSDWFPSSQYEPAGTPSLEVYSDGDTSSSKYYSEIWIPLIEKA